MLFRPLFVELSQQQLGAIQEALEGADEEAVVTSVVEQLRGADGTWHLEHQIRLVRAWSAAGGVGGHPVSPRQRTRLRAWLRVLERDEELHGWGSAWTRDVERVDLWPTR